MKFYIFLLKIEKNSFSNRKLIFKHIIKYFEILKNYTIKIYVFQNCEKYFFK